MPAKDGLIFLSLPPGRVFSKKLTFLEFVFGEGEVGKEEMSAVMQNRNE